MGTRKISKYYCIIIFLLFFASCSITIKEYKLKDVKDWKIKISVINKTHEPALTSLFIKNIEEKLIKRGAFIVDKDEDCEITVILNTLKTQAVAYTSKDIIGANIIQITGAFTIKTKNKNTPDSYGVFNISNNYEIKNIIESERERNYALTKAAREASESIYGKLVTLSVRP